MIRIAAFASDQTACSWQRLFLPLYWARQLGLADVRWGDKPDEALCRWADVVVYQRHYEQKPLDWWRTMVSWPDRPALVYEMDDDVWSIPPSNPFKRFYSSGVCAGIEEMVRGADLVTVPSAGLAKVIEPYNASVVILPSGIDPQAFTLQRRRVDDGTVRIGYAGSDTHDHDFVVMANAIRRVLRKQPQATLVLKGCMADPLVKVVPASQLERHPWEDFRSGYYPHLAALGVDVWLCPLAHIRFNAGKSNVKWLEAAMLATPLVASPVGIFAQTIEHGVTGFLANSQAAWEETLLQVIANAELRERVGRAAWTVAYERYRYDVLARHWIDTYARIPRYVDAVRRRNDGQGEIQGDGTGPDLSAVQEAGGATGARDEGPDDVSRRLSAEAAESRSGAPLEGT